MIELQKKGLIFKICLIGLCAGLYMILNLLTFKIGGFLEISFTLLPIIFIAIVYGPIEGMIVAAAGEFVNQLSYELSIMTLVWMIAPILCGLIVGLLFKNRNPLEQKVRFIITICVMQLCVTGANTLSMYLNNLIFIEWPIEIVLWMIPIRFAVGVVMCVLYGAIVPLIFKPLFKLNKIVYKEKDSD